MPNDWPVWLHAPVLVFGVISFVAVWTIVIRGIFHELHSTPQSAGLQEYIDKAAPPPNEREQRGE